MADTVKQVLPAPYNQDLSTVLRGLDRRTRAARDRLANDPVTAAYLAAAMRLLERQLGPGVARTTTDPDDETSVERPLLKLLSQRAVASEVANNPDPFPRQGNVPTLRATWKSQSDFIADVLRFGLWSRHFLGPHADDVALDAEQLVHGPDVVDAIHAVCYRTLTTLIAMPAFRLQILASAAAEGDEVIRGAMGDYYQQICEALQQGYAAAIETHGLRLRAGITIFDFTYLVHAAAEGLALRAISDPGARVLDHDHGRSLHGTLVLALVLGCTESAVDPQPRTLEQAVHAAVHGEPAGSRRPAPCQS